MSAHPETHTLPREERIRAIAYALWEEEGCPHGRDLEHWNRATELVDAEIEDTRDWMHRSEADVLPGAEPAADSPQHPGSHESFDKASLDDLVRKMKSGRAA
jgi:hypothetical protein